MTVAVQEKQEVKGLLRDALWVNPQGREALQKPPWIKPGNRRLQRIYVASALSTLPVGVAETRSPSTVVCEYISNLSRMAELATNLRNLGYFPYVPGLDFLLGIRTGDWHEEDYRMVSMSFLEVCDAVLVGTTSKGVDVEVRRAIDLGIPVFSDINNLERVNSLLPKEDKS